MKWKQTTVASVALMQILAKLSLLVCLFFFVARRKHFSIVRPLHADRAIMYLAFNTLPHKQNCELRGVQAFFSVM